MTIGQAALGLIRPVDHVAADVHERRAELVLLHEVVELVVRAVGTVVKRKTPGVGLRAGSQVRGNVVVLGLGALRGRPPAVRVLVNIVGLCSGRVNARVALHTLLGLNTRSETRLLDLAPDLVGLIVALDDASNLPVGGKLLLELVCLRRLRSGTFLLLTVNLGGRCLICRGLAAEEAMVPADWLDLARNNLEHAGLNRRGHGKRTQKDPGADLHGKRGEGEVGV